MREIKFRAWNEQTNEMIIPSMIDNPCKTSINEKYYRQHYILMQYTGLKDKNGVDIYEGDIIRHPKATEPENLGWIVQWHSYAFIVKMVSDTDTMYQLNNQFSSCEVIGNIYEHQDLLK